MLVCLILSSKLRSEKRSCLWVAAGTGDFDSKVEDPLVLSLIN